MRRAALLAALAICGSVTHLHAQQSSMKPSTNAELRARVATLEAEITRLQRDYELVLATCQQVPAAEPRSAPPVGRLEREVTPRLPEPSQPTGTDHSWFLRSLDYGVIETNRVFSRFSWAVTLNNGGGERPRAFDVTIQFLDSNGLIIDTDNLYRQVVGAFGEETFRGSALVRMPSALNVVKAVANVKVR